MGRLNRTEQNEASASVHYDRLKDETVCERSKVMPTVSDYFSFNCKHCGHTQLFQVSELEMIIGKSLKMALRSRRDDSTDVTSSSFNQRQNEGLFKENISTTSDQTRHFNQRPDKLEGTSLGIPLLPMISESNQTQGYNVFKSPQSNISKNLLQSLNVSSDECNSPTQLNTFKRIVEKPSLMKLIGKGLVASTSDEEGYPLVSNGSSSIPGSQTNLSVNSDNARSNVAKGTAKIDEEKKLNSNLPKNLSDESNFEYGGSISSEEFANAPTIQRISPVDPSVFSRTRDGELRMAPWYQEGIPREIALEILSQEPIGSFMVRRSTTKIGCFALSVRVPRSFQPRGIAHYLIMKTNKGYRIKGFTKEFSTLASLIAHHSVMPELLPCPLSLSRYHPVCIISDSRRDFADIELQADG